MSSVLAFAFGYLLGSIPFGLLLTPRRRRPDIRSIGSGNIRATNVLRTGRKWLAAITLFCDMFKGHRCRARGQGTSAPTPRLRPVLAPLSATSFRSG